MAKKDKNIGLRQIEPLRGRVIKNTGSTYRVRTEYGEEIDCRIKGSFRIKGIRTTNPVAVGDEV